MAWKLAWSHNPRHRQDTGRCGGYIQGNILDDHMELQHSRYRSKSKWYTKQNIVSQDVATFVRLRIWISWLTSPWGDASESSSSFPLWVVNPGISPSCPPVLRWLWVILVELLLGKAEPSSPVDAFGVSSSKPCSSKTSSGSTRSIRSKFWIRISTERPFSASSGMCFSTTKYLTMPTFLSDKAIPSKDLPLDVRIGV